jgi:poly(A) polymerase
MKISNVGHDEESAKMAEEILKRMKYPTEIIEVCADIISKHMEAFQVMKSSRKPRIRRFLGQKNIEFLTKLVAADEAGTINGLDEPKFTPFKKEWDKRFPDMLPKPLITGNDLVNLGLKPGPAFKFTLDCVYNLQLGEHCDREAMLKQAPGFYKQYQELQEKVDTEYKIGVDLLKKNTNSSKLS